MAVLGARPHNVLVTDAAYFLVAFGVSVVSSLNKVTTLNKIQQGSKQLDMV